MSMKELGKLVTTYTRLALALHLTSLPLYGCPQVTNTLVLSHLEFQDAR
jgi:hypothetical protein